MKIYDITQELFSSVVFPGDPSPAGRKLSSISEGDLCNVTELSMCAHNGTHIDAPCHFIEGGAAIDEIPLESTVGECFVTHFDGTVTEADAVDILEKAKKYSLEAAKRILIGGRATVSEEAATVFAEGGIMLIGNESQTVGPEDAPMRTHLILLGAGVILLEGIRLGSVPEGRYLLSASPLLLSGSDGSPCRAVLLEI